MIKSSDLIPDVCCLSPYLYRMYDISRTNRSLLSANLGGGDPDSQRGLPANGEETKNGLFFSPTEVVGQKKMD